MMLALGIASAQSPSEQTSAVIGGKNVSIKYSAPSVRGRQIFGDGGQLSHDGTYPVWRAGANQATALHTDGDLTIGNLAVPAGDYTLYVLVKDPNAWQLIVNKQTKQWGTNYSEAQDLGRVPMKMSKPPAPIEKFKITLTSSTLQMEWENHVASVPVAAK
jgi:hypothetical protein